MSHRVISLTDSKYFNCGQLFIHTRKRVDADFVVYSPDLRHDQKSMLEKFDIQVKYIPRDRFDTEMMYLKFPLLYEEMCLGFDKLTFVDFDTFFIKDWKEFVFNWNFDLGITVRNDILKYKRNCIRAYANGGVIFVRNTSQAKHLIADAMVTIKEGKNDLLPEYNEIWQTLESGDRPEHKRHFRTNYRCWVDQVFLSAIVLRHCKKFKIKTVEDCVGTSFNNYIIGLFNCDIYNKIGALPNQDIMKGVYIKHLKARGRRKLGVKEDMLGA